jgi:hypothetical protein
MRSGDCAECTAAFRRTQQVIQGEVTEVALDRPRGADVRGKKMPFLLFFGH